MPITFDNRPYLTDRSSDGQLYHSGDSPTRFYNCTMEALRETARDYGYGEPYNDDQLRAFGAPGSAKGLPWQVSLDAALRAFPDLQPDMVIFWPNDLIGTVRFFGQKGWLMHCGFKCDADANVPPIGPVTYSHAERILWADDGGIGMENVEPHPDVYLTDQQFLDLYDGGGLLVFRRSVIPPPPTPKPTEESPMIRDKSFSPGGQVDFPGCHNGPVDDKTSRTTVYVTSRSGQGEAHIFLNDDFTGAELAHVYGSLGKNGRPLFYDTCAGAGQAGIDLAPGKPGGLAIVLPGTDYAHPTADFTVRVIVPDGDAKDVVTVTVVERQRAL